MTESSPAVPQWRPFSHCQNILYSQCYISASFHFHIHEDYPDIFLLYLYFNSIVVRHTLHNFSSFNFVENSEMTKNVFIVGKLVEEFFKTWISLLLGGIFKDEVQIRYWCSHYFYITLLDQHPHLLHGYCLPF